MLSRLVPTNTTMKHQASAPNKVISGVLAIQLKARPTKESAVITVNRVSNRMPRKLIAISPISGFCRLGWIRMAMITQMSWKIRIPSDSRPGTVSSSKFSWNSLTTSSVEEQATIAPT